MTQRVIGYIKKLLEPKQAPPPDIDALAGQLLRTLPRCTARVVVASPNYGDQRYRADIVADTVSLLSWAEHHAQAVLGSMDEIQAAREALPVWLRDADLSNPAVSYVASPFVALLRPYAKGFISRSIAQALCSECRRFVRDVSFNTFNERNGDGWSWWIAEWHCSSGHLLYREDHGICI